MHEEGGREEEGGGGSKERRETHVEKRERERERGMDGMKNGGGIRRGTVRQIKRGLILCVSPSGLFI